MKSILIVRHAQASYSFQGLKDFDRPLDKEGVKEANIMSEQLIKKIFIPDYIISSGAKRALTTAKIISKHINYKENNIDVDDSIYNSSYDQIIDVIKGVPDKYNKLMITGHNPTFHYLSQLLSNESIMSFPTCSMFAIAFNVDLWSKVYRGKKKFMISPELYKNQGL